jgi:hypothetical protein
VDERKPLPGITGTAMVCTPEMVEGCEHSTSSFFQGPAGMARRVIACHLVPSL